LARDHPRTSPGTGGNKVLCPHDRVAPGSAAELLLKGYRIAVDHMIASFGMNLPIQLIEQQFNIAIDFDGVWTHEGTAITRKSLVQLFASILRRDEAGQYWLQTPVEKGRIAVADVPFVATSWRIEQMGKEDQRLYLTDNLGREVGVNGSHPLALRIPRGKSGPPVPYHQIGEDLEARMNRSVYYALIDVALQQGEPIDGYLKIMSFNSRHPLGIAS
jgi:uncharacterized protein